MTVPRLCRLQTASEYLENLTDVSALKAREERWKEAAFTRLPELSAVRDSKICKFKVPKIKFKAKTYLDLFNWRTATITEKPFIASLSDDQIKNLVNTPLTPPAFTCHTQVVERGIWLVTEAASSVFGAEARDGFIRQRIKSRKEVGSLKTKAKFFPKLEKLWIGTSVFKGFEWTE